MSLAILIVSFNMIASSASAENMSQAEPTTPSVFPLPTAPNKPTAAGWREYLSTGVPFFGNSQDLKEDIQDLQAFLTNSESGGAPDDRRYLENARSRLQKLATIQEGFALCAAQRGKALPYLDYVLAGARDYAQVNCGIENPAVANITEFKDIVKALNGDVAAANKKEAAEKLRQLARARALQSVEKLMTEYRAANPKDLASSLSSHLDPLAKEIKAIKQKINPQLKGLEASADQRAHELFELNSSRYKSLYSAMLASPNGSLVLTKSLVDKIGFQRSADDIEVKKRDRIHGVSFIVIDIPDHPASISETDVGDALKNEVQELEEIRRELQTDKKISLKDLTLRFPVNVGESLMETNPENIPDLIHDLCRIATGKSMQDNMKKNLFTITNVALTASTVLSGGSAAGASALGREGLKRALLAGAAAAGAGADVMSIAQFADSKIQRDEVLDLARQNPTLAQNPEEMKRIETALKEYEEMQRSAILTGATSSVSALGAFKMARLFAKKADDPLSIAEEAKRRLRAGPDDFDSFVGELYSNTCRIR